MRRDAAPAEVCVLDLPLPPSANALHVTVRGRRVRSARYTRWLRDVRWLMLRAPTYGRSTVEVAVAAPIDRRRDLDNVAKPLLDALVAHEVIRDDRMVDRLVLERVPGRGLARLTVRMVR